MARLIKLFPNKLYWPTFDKTWPLNLGLPPSRKVAFAAMNYSDEHFDTGYQGASSFRYFEFPMCSVLQDSPPKIQAEFLAGRLCAHQLLYDFAVHHDYLDNDIEQSPVWPKGIIGSIAHSFPYSLAMIANAKDYLSIGLAMEDIISAELPAHSAQGQLMHDEPLCLALGIDLNSQSLICCFKQSVINALFPLLPCYFDFDDIKVTLINWKMGEVRSELIRDLSNEWKKGDVLISQFDFYQTKVIALTLIADRGINVSLFE